MNGTSENMLTRRIMELDVWEINILFSVLLIIMLVSIVGNLFLIVTIISKKEMRTPHYIFLANLVVCGLLFGLLCIPLTLGSLMKTDWLMNVALCQFHGFLTSIFFVSAILTITAMTIEKYFSLARPVSRYMTSNKAKIILVEIWLVACCYGILPIVGLGHYAYNSTMFSCGVGYPRNSSEKFLLLMTLVLFNVVPVQVMFMAYWKIFLSLRKHSKRIKCFSQYNQAPYKSLMRLQKHLIITVLLTLLVFLSCWTPFVFLILMVFFTEDVYHIPRGFPAAAYWFACSASSWNVVLYITRNRKFTETLYQSVKVI